MLLLLDHLVSVVDDPPRATTGFESRGFTVRPGGTNGSTYNAFKVLSNDTFIELVTLQPPRAQMIMGMLRRIGFLMLRL